MVFNSFQFFLFFIIVFSLYRILNHQLQNRLLLFASYLFYASWNWWFLILLWLNTIVSYFCALLIHQQVDLRKRKLFLTIGLSLHLGILGYFKVFNFLIDGLEDLVALIGWQLDKFTIKLSLPVGLSFYTFQSIGYLLDVYRRDQEPSKNFLDFALFIGFFPQLLAGPIMRAKMLLSQIFQTRKITGQHMREGIWLIYWGLFTKVFVADNLAKIVDSVFLKTGVLSGGEALMGIYAFAFQIYGDFAGYSTIAMGLAKLLGIDLVNNFRFPYFVTNPREFWQNWHISLSTWARDYLYIPLGGNRGTILSTYRNIFLTMLLMGLWHGVGFTFVLWGMYHAAILIIYRMAEPLLQRAHFNWRPTDVILDVLRVILMFQFTCLGWLIFRAQSVQQVTDFLGNIFFNAGSPSWIVGYYALQIAFYTIPLLIVQILQKKRNDMLAVLQLPPIPRWAVFILMFYLMTMWGEFGGKEFYYFNF